MSDVQVKTPTRRVQDTRQIVLRLRLDLSTVVMAKTEEDEKEKKGKKLQQERLHDERRGEEIRVE